MQITQQIYEIIENIQKQYIIPKSSSKKVILTNIFSCLN